MSTGVGQIDFQSEYTESGSCISRPPLTVLLFVSPQVTLQEFQVLSNRALANRAFFFASFFFGAHPKKKEEKILSRDRINR